jgi:hypothetical protein
VGQNKGAVRPFEKGGASQGDLGQEDGRGGDEKPQEIRAWAPRRHGLQGLRVPGRLHAPPRMREEEMRLEMRLVQDDEVPPEVQRIRLPGREKVAPLLQWLSKERRRPLDHWHYLPDEADSAASPPGSSPSGTPTSRASRPQEEVESLARRQIRLQARGFRRPDGTPLLRLGGLPLRQRHHLLLPDGLLITR